MIRALVVSSHPFRTAALFGQSSGLYVDETTCDRATHARRMLSEDAFELIVINAPLSDEYGVDLACYAAEKTSAGILLFVKAADFEPAASKAERVGVIVVAKPCSAAYEAQCARIAAATAARMGGMKRVVANLQDKIAEVKLIDRAKCLLVQYLGMSEEEAHRYIEKQAMDNRTGRLEVAREILRTYES